VANVDLTAYDGSAGYLVDSNVWIDCIVPASPWHTWAVDQLQACSERAPLHVDPRPYRSHFPRLVLVEPG
jgi:hypothetical protein